MSNQTPQFTISQAVDRFIDAVNRSDREGATAAFAVDAFVNDIRREFVGSRAIQAWLAREIFDDAVHLEVLGVRANHQTTIVTARTTGSFDKTNIPDPLDLTFYFTASSDKIAQLIVISNEPTPDWARSPQVAS